MDLFSSASQKFSIYRYSTVNPMPLDAWGDILKEQALLPEKFLTAEQTSIVGVTAQDEAHRDFDSADVIVPEKAVTFRVTMMEKAPTAQSIKLLTSKLERQYIVDHQVAAVSRKMKKQLKEEAIEILQPDAPVTYKGLTVTLVPDDEVTSKEGYMFLGETLPKSCDAAAYFFLTRFDGILEDLQFIRPETVATGLENYGGMEYCKEGLHTEELELPIPRDLMAYTIMKQTSDNPIEVAYNGQLFTIAVDSGSAVTLQGATDVAMECKEVKISKGMTVEVPEFFQGLYAGKTVKTATFLAGAGDDVYSFTYDANKLAFSGVKFPAGAEFQKYPKAAELADMLITLAGIIRQWYKTFAVATEEVEELEADMRDWIENGHKNSLV